MRHQTDIHVKHPSCLSHSEDAESELKRWGRPRFVIRGWRAKSCWVRQRGENLTAQGLRHAR
jgi:hypothetical protein